MDEPSDSNAALGRVLVEDRGTTNRALTCCPEGDPFGRAASSRAERALVRGVRAPYGDFRDWDDVSSWAAEIARLLERSGPVAV